MAILTSFPSDTLTLDLLTRLTDIQSALPWVTYSARNLYESINGPYPSFYNFHSNTSYDYSNGTTSRVDVMDITMRLVGGSLSSSVFHQVEDTLNQRKTAVANMFTYRKWLEDPATQQPFLYLAPFSGGVQMLSDSRITGLNTEQGTALLGVDFKIRCPMLVSIPRLS